MKFSRTSAPAARAASSSTVSSSVRRGLHIMSTPSLAGIRAENAAAPWSKRTVRVDGVPDAAALDALRSGVALGDGTRTRPARLRSLGSGRDGTWLEIVLTEGKNRQVRRMCAAVGHEVRELVRVRIGDLELGDLARGRWRRLGSEDLALLETRAAASRGERSVR